jgi:hypothetical protein
MIRLLSAAVLTLLLCPACPSEKKRDQLYFADLKIPIGVGKVTVVSDVSLNPSTGGEITVLTAVEPEVDRDELDRLMDSFLRQVKERTGFAGSGKPEKIDLRFYVGEDKAKAGGADWLAQLTASASGEPTKINKQKAPLLKWAMKKMGKMQEFTGTLKPQLLANPSVMALDLTFPIVEHDGTGTYVAKLTYVRAITEFVSYTMTMFEGIPELKKLTFVAKHDDAVVMKIWLTREQYVKLDLRKIEEGLGAFDGALMEKYLSKEVNDKAFEARKVAQRRKVYREALARLPAEQVELTKELR